jgi:hypothetical protein
MNIQRWGMDIDTRSPICWRLNEDGGHCFLNYKFVKKYWTAINLEEIRLCLVDLNSAKQVASKILSLDDDRKSLVVSLLRAWWNAQNKANVGDKMLSTEEIIYKAKALRSDINLYA